MLSGAHRQATALDNSQCHQQLQERGKPAKRDLKFLKLTVLSISTADGKMMLQPLPKIHNEGHQCWKSPTLSWSGGADEASLTQTKQGKWTKTNWGFQEAKRAVNHKMYSVPVTSGIPWHHRTTIVLVRMRNDLNRNAIQSAETQNKSTGKQDKAAYLVSPSNPSPRTWPEKN